jgi:hypothetical protein
MRKDIDWQKRLADETGVDDVEWDADENTLLWDELGNSDLARDKELGEEDAE